MSGAAWGTCNLSTCSVEQSIFKYRPSLPANSTFIALFGLSLAIHAIQGVLYRQWTFAILMVLGCACEIVGYAGRIMMYDNPWNFSGFLIQVICITIAPVFMTAAIYVQLYKSIMELSPSSAQLKPSLYYQLFIPADIISLILQSAGGALSTRSSGASRTGVNIGLAGLSFQVFTLVVFIALCVQYGLRYRRDLARKTQFIKVPDGKFKFFLTFLGFATLVILVRCTFRIYELSGGYRGSALHDQGLFIALESCMIVLAVFALNVGHPGLGLHSSH